MDFDKLSDTDKIAMVELTMKIQQCIEHFNRGNRIKEIDEMTKHILDKTKQVSSLL